MPMRVIGMIGVTPPTSAATLHVIEGGLSPNYVAEAARAHEASGFDLVLVGYSSYSAEGFLVALHVAARTERLGYLIAHRPGFVAPTLMARKIATFDHLSSGRLALHIITGKTDDEHASVAASASTTSAPFSPIITAAALVLPDTTVGMIEASITRRRSKARTRKRSSTTAKGSVAHAAGRGRVIDRGAGVSREGEKLAVADAMLAGRALLRDVAAHRRLVHDPAHRLHSGDHGVAIAAR